MVSLHRLGTAGSFLSAKLEETWCLNQVWFFPHLPSSPCLCSGCPGLPGPAPLLHTCHAMQLGEIAQLCSPAPRTAPGRSPAPPALLPASVPDPQPLELPWGPAPSSGMTKVFPISSGPAANLQLPVTQGSRLGLHISALPCPALVRILARSPPPGQAPRLPRPSSHHFSASALDFHILHCPSGTFPPPPPSLPPVSSSMESG